MSHHRKPDLILEHPELGGYVAHFGRDYYGTIPGCDWLEIIDDEGDVIFCYLNRMDPPELRLAKMRDLLCEHGFVRPGEDDPLGPLG